MKVLEMTTDYFKPDTWIAYQESNCRNCHADCCRLQVDVSPSDLIRMQVASAEEFSVNELATFEKLKRQGIIKSFNIEKKYGSLNQFADNRCLYLKDGRCRIYEKRPDTCRQFPVIGPRANYCPFKEKY
jgi:Fe-S-cluster containining protein